MKLSAALMQSLSIGLACFVLQTEPAMAQTKTTTTTTTTKASINPTSKKKKLNKKSVKKVNKPKPTTSVEKDIKRDNHNSFSCISCGRG